MQLLKVVLFVGVGFSLALGAAEAPKSPQGHPRLLFNQADLPGIKERAAGECKGFYQSLKNQADEWLTRQVKLPDKGGQWFHWYSCPKHGARLKTESPTRHVCPVDQQVFTGYPYDDVVISTEHNRLAGAIRTLGIVYQIGGDPRHAAKAKEILLAYADKYESYPLHDINGRERVGGGKVGPQTLDESTWLITVAEGADCIWETLSPDEQQKATKQLFMPATEVIRAHKMGIHNIQCWKNSAVGLTGLLLGDMALFDEALNAPVGYQNQLAKGVTADGPWFEGAWGYHFYTLSALLHLTEAAYHCGINLYNPDLKRVFDAPLAMAMPDLTLPAFNDSHAVALTGNAAAYQTAWARYHDPQYLLLAGRNSRANENALLQGLPDRGPAPAFQPASRNFTASGNAILAAGAGTNATWLCMKYGPHGGGHGHPDKLNFVLYGRGQVIAPDPGTANYGVPIQAGWYRTTLAHNTLCVDEQSQGPAQGQCLAFIATNDFSAVMADAGKVFHGAYFTRTVALFGTNLLVFLDQVRSEDTHTYDFVYHNRGHLAVPGIQIPAFTPSDKPGYSYLRDTHAQESSSSVRVRFDVDDQTPVWWALAGGDQTTVITGTGVGQHTEDRVPLVIARRQAKTTFCLWCVCLGPGGEHVALEAQEVSPSGGGTLQPGTVAAVRVMTPSGNHIVVANTGAQPVRVAGQQVDGKIALLSQTGTAPPQVRYVAR